jgi:hypothetical protein
LSKYDNWREKNSPNLVTLSHFFTKTLCMSHTGLVFFVVKKWQKFTKEKNEWSKTYFSGPRKSKMWQTSLSVLLWFT